MISSKRILFIITHLEMGGAQKQLLATIKALQKYGYSVTLCSSDYGYLKHSFLTLPYLKVKFISQLIREINPIKDIIAFFKIYHFIKKHKFDIVHTHSPKASFLGRWAAYFAGTKKIIYTVHGWPFHSFMSKSIYKLYLFLEWITAKITTKIIVVSHYDLEIGIKSNIAHKDRFSLIHYGIESEELKRLSAPRSYKKTPTVVLTISALKPQKGLYFFLEVAEHLLRERPHLNFIIAGDGPWRERIKKRIAHKQLQNRVILKGWIKDIHKLWQEVDLFVLTSLWEGLPLAVIEAVIAGVPVVATDTGGLRDIVKDEKQGMIVDVANVDELCKACLQILQNYSKWIKMVKGREETINFNYWSLNRKIEELVKLYERL